MTPPHFFSWSTNEGESQVAGFFNENVREHLMYSQREALKHVYGNLLENQRGVLRLLELRIGRIACCSYLRTGDGYVQYNGDVIVARVLVEERGNGPFENSYSVHNHIQDQQHQRRNGTFIPFPFAED
jgi:hypothetical protein